MAFTRRAVPAIDPVRVIDVTEAVSNPLTFEPGHPLRRLRCLFCAMTIGGRPCRVATIIDFRAAGCNCEAVPTVSYLICAEHAVTDVTDYATPALARWQAHHGKACG